MPSLAFVVVASLYCWLAASDGQSWNWGAKQGDYYNQLIDGFLDGHLYMKVEVPQALKDHPNPYNPALRPGGLGLHDASYYQGHYYLYFGAAPALLTMLPFRLVTGIDLPLRASVLFFLILGYGAGLACLAAIRKRYFPETGWWLFFFCALALGGANFAPLILRRASLWELPISAGYAFSMLALWFVHLSLQARRRELWWFFFAGLALGLAVASRLSYLYACALLFVPAFYWWRQMPGSPGANWKRATARLAAGAFPAVCIGLGMAWYNIARFGDPLEFGVRYQLSGINEAVARHFRFGYFPYDQYLYLWQPAAWTPYFPFIQLPAQPSPPPGHLGSEHLYGFFTNMPFALLAFALPLAWRRRPNEEAVKLRAWGLSATVLAAAVAATLLFYLAAMSRYSMDFAGTTVLLACVSAFSIRRLVGECGAWARRPTVAFLCFASAVSVFFCLMYGFEAQGLFRTYGYPRYASLARLLNHPSHWAQRVLGTRFGPVELRFEFPRNPKAGREAILRSGAYHARDFVFLEYDGNGRARIGYSHLGGAEKLSRYFPIEAEKVSVAKVSMGSLYPPEEHPYFDTHSLAPRRYVEISLDGEPLVMGYQRAYDASPFSIEAGPSAADRRLGNPFSGTWLGMRRLPEEDAGHDEGLRIWANLGEGECRLLQFGPRESDRATLLFKNDGKENSVLECRVKGDARWRSAPFPRGASASHAIELRPFKGTILVSFDDLVVGSIPGALISPDSLPASIAAAPDTESSLETGVFGLERLETAEGGNGFRFDTIKLRLRLPAHPTQFREPLVVTGYAGRGDFIVVEYAGSNQVRFHLDHWGRLPVSSEVMALDYGAEHLVELRMGSFPGATLDEGGVGELFLSVDGKTVFEQPARFYGVSPSDLFVGRNPIGGSSAAPFFTGMLLEIRKQRTGPEDKAPGAVGNE